MTVEALAAYGVRHAVVSPGSRDIPLIIALEGDARLTKHVVIDERTAAFAALGISTASVDADGQYAPVALVCTSGTAVLNYAPAVAEAYYRGVPLIVISADRPAEWIDQDDSQTIRQNGVLDNIVKGGYCMAAEGGRNDAWLYRRTLNDALRLALAPKRGPVHINIAFDEPLGGSVDSPAVKFEKIDSVAPVAELAPETMADAWNYNRIMIVCGFMPPNPELSRLLAHLSCKDVVIMREMQSNVDCRCSGEWGVHNVDATIAWMKAHHGDGCLPQLVITLGGALLSRHLKTMLRNCPGLEHWHVGHVDNTVDCFRHISRNYDCTPLQAVQALLTGEKAYDTYPKLKIDRQFYAEAWGKGSEEAENFTDRFGAAAPWSDFTAMSTIIADSQRQLRDLQLSNGTAVRYAQFFGPYTAGAVQCNRGVSGIDGSTSTAIGYAKVSDRPVTLVTGDMSAQYDLGALALSDIPATFRMIVLDNGGGGIFRFIGSTARLDEAVLQRYFDADVRLPLRELALGFGFDYFEAADAKQLISALTDMASCKRPAILRVVTDGRLSADVLRQFYKQIETI